MNMTTIKRRVEQLFHRMKESQRGMIKVYKRGGTVANVDIASVLTSVRDSDSRVMRVECGANCGKLSELINGLIEHGEVNEHKSI